VVKKKFQRTPPSVPSNKKKKKNLKQLPQVYLQESKIVKKKGFQINPQGCLPKKKFKKKFTNKVIKVYP
jgi:hypothetical protein